MQVRGVIWLRAGEHGEVDADATPAGLSSRWRLQPLRPGDNAIPPDGTRVGLVELGMDIAPEVVDILHTRSQVKWIALVPPEALGHDPVRDVIRECCYDYHTRPVDPGRLEVTLGHAFGMAELEAPACCAVPVCGSDDDIPLVGDSPAMQALSRRLLRVAAAEVPVLLQGESGTGKELVAKAVHRHSRRADGPFVAVDCASLPAQLIQSELFGHEPGAFTGASRRKPGRLETADGGTVLLDEIGDLSVELQVHLLRFLEEGTLLRLGGTQPIQLDVRVVAATHVDLEAAVADGRFREDLYYRLNVVQVDIPPLRERGDDLMELARFYLAHFGRDRPRLRGFSRQAIEAMHAHRWPGNVRELVNRIQRAVTMAEGPLIQPADLGLKAHPHRGRCRTLAEARARAERESVEGALRESAGNVTCAARLLGVGRVTLYRLMKKHGIS